MKTDTKGCSKVVFLIQKPTYSETCLKQPLKNRQNKDLKDKW